MITLTWQKSKEWKRRQIKPSVEWTCAPLRGRRGDSSGKGGKKGIAISSACQPADRPFPSPGCRKALATEFARLLPLLHCTSRRRRARPTACSRAAADAGRVGGPFDRATAELKWPRFADARTASQGRRDERERERARPALAGLHFLK